MAVYKHDELFNEDLPKDLRSKDVCFFCGQKLIDHDYDIGGFVYWFGFGGGIALHQCCAERLSIDLIQDARSLKAITASECKLNPEAKRSLGHAWFVKGKKNA